MNVAFRVRGWVTDDLLIQLVGKELAKLKYQITWDTQNAGYGGVFICHPDVLYTEHYEDGGSHELYDYGHGGMDCDCPNPGYSRPNNAKKAPHKVHILAFQGRVITPEFIRVVYRALKRANLITKNQARKWRRYGAPIAVQS